MACPISYRLGAQALRRAPVVRASVLYAVGGLYGNLEALHAIERRAAQETSDCSVVFNGDFNFFNAAGPWWRELNASIRQRHSATAGNVEVESSGAEISSSCGCGYPDYVPPGVVERSDRIVGRLWSTAAAAEAPELLRWLRELPRALVAEVGAARTRVGVVHGDVDSLAGWQLGVEAMEPADTGLRAALGCDAASGAHLPTTPHATIARWCAEAEVAGLVCTHTCLPFGQIVRGGRLGGRLGAGGGGGAAVGGGGGGDDDAALAVFNNGSAGMPNFEGTRFGLLTRVSDDLTPPADALYGGVAHGLRFDALPVPYDHGAWLARFGAVWPDGSDARASYHDRLLHGPRGFTPRHAARGGVQLLNVQRKE